MFLLCGDLISLHCCNSIHPMLGIAVSLSKSWLVLSGGGIRNRLGKRSTYITSKKECKALKNKNKDWVFHYIIIIFGRFSLWSKVLRSPGLVSNPKQKRIYITKLPLDGKYTFSDHLSNSHFPKLILVLVL